jgi:hypothetical protein
MRSCVTILTCHENRIIAGTSPILSPLTKTKEIYIVRSNLKAFMSLPSLP